MNNQPISSTTKELSETTGGPNPKRPPVPLSHQLPPPPPPRKKHHLLGWILVAGVVLLTVGVFFIFHRGKPKTPTPPPISIHVTSVRKGDIEAANWRIGSVQSVYTAQISPRVDGQLISVNYTEGQTVESNQLLAVIDPGPYEAQKIQAEGQLARDKALLEGATVDLGRYKTAYQKNAIPKQQYDDQVALVHQDQGTVRVDEGVLTNANVQLNYCYVRAPFNGRVGLRLVDPGNVVHAANSNALVIVAQLQPITVVFSPEEDVLPQIEQQLKGGHGMTVEAWDRGQEHKLATGKLLALDNLIDASTGTIKLKAIFDNEDATLFPNQFVNTKLIIATNHNALLIPTFAIQRNPDGAFVYLVTNATATTNGVTTNYQAVVMRNITLGLADDNVTAVPEGLQAGDTIAVDNFNKLGEGVKVVIKKPGQENQPAAGKHGGGSYGKPAGGSKETQ